MHVMRGRCRCAKSPEAATGTARSCRTDGLLLLSMSRDVAVLPVRRVIFPGQVASFAIGKPASVALIEHLLAYLEKKPGRLDEGAPMPTGICA